MPRTGMLWASQQSSKRSVAGPAPVSRAVVHLSPNFCGLIVPNLDPQIGNQSEHRIGRTKTGCRPVSRAVGPGRRFKPNNTAAHPRAARRVPWARWRL